MISPSVHWGFIHVRGALSAEEVKSLNDGIDAHRGMACSTVRIMGKYMGVSENSVPLNPMVNDHYPY